MESEFDRFADDYRTMIDKTSRLAGGTLIDFVDLRLDLLAERLTITPQVILDFGCGIGVTAERIRLRFPDAQIVGVDMSRESLRRAEALEIPGSRFIAPEDGRIPLDEASVDLVYSNGTIHHIPVAERAGAFAEIRRVLRPGGQSFVFENNPLNPVMNVAMRTAEIDRDAHALLPWKLRRLHADAGLPVRETAYYVFLPAPLRSLRWTERYLRKLPLGAQYVVQSGAD